MPGAQQALNKFYSTVSYVNYRFNNILCKIISTFAVSQETTILEFQPAKHLIGNIYLRTQELSEAPLKFKFTQVISLI